MDTSSRTQPPIWYWIGTALFVLWALFGVLGMLRSFTITATTQSLGPPGFFLALATAIPAILSDAVGALGLVMRKAWAVPALAIALAFTAFYGVGRFVATSDATVVFLALVVFVTPRALALWLALASNARGWSVHGVARGVVPAA